MSLQSRIDYSIDLLKRTEPLALKMHPEGFHLAFSGGKDSQVLYHIAQMAGVKFHAHMQITTLDPPALMRFIRANYPDVELHRPPKNFYQLLEEKGSLPTRRGAWCCEKLKEHAGAGRLTLTGVRAAESAGRASRGEVSRVHRDPSKRKLPTSIFDAVEVKHLCTSKNDHIVVSPILQWTDADVWNFIRGRGISYCELYDQGWRRIGCVMCPKAAKSSRLRERAAFPGVERAIVRSIDRVLQRGGMKSLASYNPTAQEVFEWWISGESVAKFFGNLRNQTKLDF